MRFLPIKFNTFIFVLLGYFASVNTGFSANCPNGYHSAETNITNPNQQCFTTVSAGKYITHNSLPSWVDMSAYAPESESSMRFHGYNYSNDNSLAENTFATVFDYGTLYGDSACRPQDNPYGAWGVVTDWDFQRSNENNGAVCWCRLNGENDPSGLYSYKSKWVSRGYVDSGNCWSDCAKDCARITGNVSRWGDGPKNSLFNTVSVITEDCPAGSYCPGGEINYGTNGVYTCPEHSTSTSGQTSCVCDARYATANGAGATQNNPCVRLTGPESCISGTEYWDAQNQTCVARTGNNTYLVDSGKYIYPEVKVASGSGTFCHKSRSAEYCDDPSLISSLPNNSWLVHFDNKSQIFSGRSACSDIGGNFKDVSSVPFTSDRIDGGNCWCNISQPFGSDKWILSGTFSNGDICGNECAGNCAYHFSDLTDFRQQVLANATPTTANCDKDHYCPGAEVSVLDTTASHIDCPTSYPESNNGSYSINQCFATISFESNAGVVVPSQTFNYNSNSNTFSLTTIPSLTKNGYGFAGWFDNSGLSGNAITAQTQLSGSKTLYGKWNPNVININWSGTTQTEINANNAAQVVYGGNINTPRSATHVPGKRFVGWRFSKQS